MANGLRAQLMLKRLGFHYTHALGQNFIFDDQVIEAMVDAAGVLEGQNVLEIGPGPGVLTAALAARGARVLAVEIDTSLEPVLSEMLSGMPGVKVVYGDVLKVNLPRETQAFFGEARFCVVANLPYYITADIVLMLLKSDLPMDEITVTVQREAAQRMMAKVGDKQYCALAATVQYFGEPSIVLEVPSEVFTPRPHVESCLLRIKLHREKPVAARDERALMRLITACFSMRRKTLNNNLMSGYGLDRAQAEAVLTRAGLSSQIRGEALSMEELVKLSDILT